MTAIGKAVKNIKALTKALNQLTKTAQNGLKVWKEMDHAASQFSKTVGASKESMNQLRDSTRKLISSQDLAFKYNMSAVELMKSLTEVATATGRNTRYSNEDKENLAATSSVFGTAQTTKLITELDKFGLGMSDAGDIAGRMFNTAVKSGISLSNYTREFSENLKLAQQYTFKNGIKGVESMAKKAVELKMSMQQAASFAGNLRSVEDVIKTSANIQVLGSNFAEFSNPISLMYDSLNDFEGLYDKMTQTFSGLGRFNMETGEVEVSAFNKERIRAASQAMGIDYGQTMESIHNMGRRNEIARQASGNANIDDEMIDLLANAGTFKNGKAGYVNKDGEFIELSKISNKDRQELIEVTRDEGADIKSIAQDLRSLKDFQMGFEKQKDNAEAKMFGWLGDLSKTFFELIQNFLGLAIGVKIAGGIGKDIFGAISTFAGRKIPRLAEGYSPVLSKTSGASDPRNGLTKGNKHTNGGELFEVESDEYLISASNASKNRSVLNAISKGVNITEKYPFLNPDVDGKARGIPKLGKGQEGEPKEGEKISAKSNNAGNEANLVNNAFTAAAMANMFGKKNSDDNLSKNSNRKSNGVLYSGKTGLKGIKSSITKNLKWSSASKLGKTLGPAAVILDTGIGIYNIATAKNATDRGAAIGETAGSLIGAAALSWAGPLGMAVGSFIGSKFGEWAGKRLGAKREAKQKGDLKAYNLEGVLKAGAYSASELKSIRKALDNNSIATIGLNGSNKKLREKIIKAGDLKTLVSNQKNKARSKVSNTEESIGNLPKYGGGKPAEFRKEGNGGGEFIGKPHSKGGIKAVVEDREWLMDREHSAMYRDELKAMSNGTFDKSKNVVIKPNPESEIMKPSLKVEPGKKSEGLEVSKEIKIKPIDINFNGTIKLEGNNGSADITSQLLNNPSFLRTISSVIEKEIKILEKGGNIKDIAF